MEIYPQDLGVRRQVALARRRVWGQNYGGLGAAPTLNFDMPTRCKPGPLGRFWMSGVDMTPEAKAATLETARGGIYGFVGGFCGGSMGFFAPGLMAIIAAHEPVFGAVFCALGAAFCSVGLLAPGPWLRGLCRKPVSNDELDALKTAADGDTLAIAYVRLVREMVAQTVSAKSAESLREALCALGEAIDALPSVPVTETDAPTLRLDAIRVRAESVSEPDAVAAASLARRADALDRSAHAASQSEALHRRSAVLRDELLAQTESLRLGLAAARPDTVELAGLAALADSVRAVADEAAGVAVARAELDAALSPTPVISVSADAPAIQSVGLRP